MAGYNTRKKGSKKHYPVQKQWRLGFNLPSNAAQVHGALDRELSQINHRLYRQSRYYEMKVDIDSDLPDGTVIHVYALQDTWMNKKAYQLAYDMFKENSKEEHEMIGATKARWNDFRVSNGLTTSATTVDSIPSGFNGPGTTPNPVLYTGGEYLMSEVSDATGTAHTFRWVGTGVNQYNIVDEYDVTANTSTDPAFPVGANVPYDGLTDEVDDSQIQHLTDDGNAPPYQFSNLENQVYTYVGTLMVDSARTSKLSTGFFCAPCGIYALQLVGAANGNTCNGKISITAKAGDYKGVSGAPMLEL